MRAILQRVTRASVRVDDEVVGAIGPGGLVLLGVEQGDDDATASTLADKLARLRLFADTEGRMNLDAAAVDAEFLVVSQFTLAASLDRGRRPSFDRAAKPGDAAPLVDAVVEALRSRGLTVATGRFGAMMQVELVNDGPVTFVVDVPAAVTTAG